MKKSSTLPYIEPMKRASNIPYLSFLQRCSVGIIFLFALLTASTFFHIRCMQQFSAHPNQSGNVQSSFVAPMFDRTVALAQRLVDEGLNSVRNDTDESTYTKSPKFDLDSWTQRTSGGLTDYDRVLLAQIYGAADSVFEFGLGESTYIANEMKVRRYAGIDSDATWVANTRALVSDNYRFYFADIGPTVAWGYPKDRLNAPSKSIYHYQIMPLAAEKEAFDVYMSDGRWRIPCLIASFLHASARGGDPRKTIGLLHDCFRTEHWMNGTEPLPVKPRLAYFKADHLLDLVDHSESRLCVFKRKPETTDEQLAQFWEENYDLIE